MAVFIDTSAIYAGIDARDPSHAESVSIWERLLLGSDRLLTHSLIEVESVALIQARLGVEPVNAFRDLVLPSLQVVEVSRDRRREALSELIADGRRGLSVVDRVSFAVMRELGIGQAFAFDHHFAEAGFGLAT